MTDLYKVKGWIEEYVRLKRMEAKKIIEVHGHGPISDVKLDAAYEAEKWLESNPTDLDNPISVSSHFTPDNFKISHVFPNGSYTEYKFADGTIKRVAIIKPHKGEKCS